MTTRPTHAADFVALMRADGVRERLDDIVAGLRDLRRDYMRQVAEIDCLIEAIRKARGVV